MHEGGVETQFTNYDSTPTLSEEGFAIAVSSWCRLADGVFQLQSVPLSLVTPVLLQRSSLTDKGVAIAASFWCCFADGVFQWCVGRMNVESLRRSGKFVSLVA